LGFIKKFIVRYLVPDPYFYVPNSEKKRAFYLLESKSWKSSMPFSIDACQGNPIEIANLPRFLICGEINF
jgi:hypothetical protein